jgi:hypothetical protein
MSRRKRRSQGRGGRSQAASDRLADPSPATAQEPAAEPARPQASTTRPNRWLLALAVVAQGLWLAFLLVMALVS